MFMRLEHRRSHCEKPRLICTFAGKTADCPGLRPQSNSAVFDGGQLGGSGLRSGHASNSFALRSAATLVLVAG